MRKVSIVKLMLLVMTIILIGAIACAKATPTPTPKPTATATPTATPAPGVTPQPTATPTPTVAAGPPDPKSAANTVTILVRDVPPGSGLNRAGAPDALHYYGVGETFFQPVGSEFTNPMLAESFEVAQDLSKVTIHLRQGVQFQKGFGEMTADDVAWSLNDANAAITPTSIHGQAGDFSALFGEAQAIDTYTLEIPFTNYDVTWASYYLNDAGQALSILSKKAYDQEGEDYSRENIVATGPYEVIEWVRDDHALVEGVSFTHWRVNPEFERMRLLEVPEQAAQLAMLNTGEADAADLDLKFIPGLLKTGFKTTSGGGGFTAGVAFAGNLWETTSIITGQPLDTSAVYMRQYPWISPSDDDTRMENARIVRHALSIAVDREAIAEQITEGVGWPEYIVTASVTDPHFQDQWKEPYDPELAKQMIADAGYPNGFRGVLYVQTENVPPEIADAIGGYWSNIGVPSDVLKQAYAVFRPGIVARTNVVPWLAFFDEGTSNRPFDWPKGLQMCSVSRGGASAGFESPYIAERYIAAGKEPDLAKRLQITTEVVDYEFYWGLIPGFVNLPFLTVYNPKSIAEWPQGAKTTRGINDPENIKSAR